MSGADNKGSLEQFLKNSLVAGVQSKLTGGSSAAANGESSELSESGSSTTADKLKQFGNDRIVKNLRPWSQFVDTKKFRVPRLSEGGPQRIAQNFAANLSHWAANYVVSALAISLVAVLMNPSFLVVSLVLGALWLYSSLYMQDISVPLGGRTIVIGMRERSIALTVVTVVLCYVANVTSTLLWIIGACVVAIVLHALFRVPEDQATEADFSLGEVV